MHTLDEKQTSAGSLLRACNYGISGEPMSLNRLDRKDLDSLPFEKVFSTRGHILTRYACWLTQGECSCKYRYGGVARPPHKFPVWLNKLTTHVARAINVSPNFMNSCNVNKYVTADHDCYWHQDDESLFRASDLDRDTFRVSLSLGDPKVFSVRVKYANHEDPITLYDGDIYVMLGLFQDKYQHSIKRGQPNLDSSSSSTDDSRPFGVRFNLTWRWQRSHLSRCECYSS